MVNGEEKNGSSTLDVSDDSSSRVSFEESVCSRSKGMLRGMTASRKAISTSKVPKHARTMLQIRARRRNASYTPRYTSFGKRFSPPCSSLARCIILWCFSGFLLYKCLVSSFWQKFRLFLQHLLAGDHECSDVRGETSFVCSFTTAVFSTLLCQCKISVTSRRFILFDCWIWSMCWYWLQIFRWRKKGKEGRVKIVNCCY